MALIKCPECGKEISDKSKACIHCGYPVDCVTPGSGENKKYKVILINAGNDILKCMYVIREIKYMSIADAKGIIDNLPQLIIGNIDYDKAVSIKSQFENIGATAEIKVSDGVEEARILCPRCRSSQITTGARGFSFVTGFIGSDKTVNRCSKCGYKWTPRL